jgi:hypothetical protein
MTIESLPGHHDHTPKFCCPLAKEFNMLSSPRNSDEKRKKQLQNIMVASLRSTIIKGVNLATLITPPGPYEYITWPVTDECARPQNSTPRKAGTVEPIVTKFSRIDYAAEITEFTKFGTVKGLK